ncbi:MAG: hypothetical protein K2R93_19700 [Gemmatimonadaceae bacterium]|nr:hypothetical protein [Gemmatimonadaceae bacterium]
MRLMFTHAWRSQRRSQADVVVIEGNALRCLRASGWEEHALDQSLSIEVHDGEAWLSRAQAIVKGTFADPASRRRLIVCLGRPFAVMKRIPITPGDALAEVSRRVREAPERYFIGLGEQARTANAAWAPNGDTWIAGFRGEAVDMARRLGQACGYTNTLVVPLRPPTWSPEGQVDRSNDLDFSVPVVTLNDKGTPLFVAPSPIGKSDHPAISMARRSALAAACVVAGYLGSVGIARLSDE